MVGVASEVKRSAAQYEQELRRRGLAVSRALLQALPTDRPPTAREFADARRALAHAIRELRGLRRELDLDIKQLRARPAGAARPRGADTAQARRDAKELARYEAARNAVDEVLARWEGRRAQLAAEIERRGQTRR